MKILICILISFSVYSKQMVKLDKGSAAPFDGILSDSAQMKEFRQINESKKYLEIQNIKLKELNDINSLNLKELKERNAKLINKVEVNETRNFWSRLGYFTLGVLATGLAAKVAIESTR